MKRKQKEEIRGKSIGELAAEVEKRQAEVLQLKIEVSLAKVKDTSALRRKADELAVVKTILQEKRFQDENVPR